MCLYRHVRSWSLPPILHRNGKHRHNADLITGLAQINGETAISWNDKLSYDVKYADNVTFWGDLKIAKKPY
ncbi:MAG: sugar transferase [Bacilli bacterium]